ncbi:hypothetical protein [Nocardiopsis alba]|uniref:hypothetical protein n=1 Tax=Nocardiopsis alba TaxID=53437 RepID=UPI003D71E988
MSEAHVLATVDVPAGLVAALEERDVMVEVPNVFVASKGSVRRLTGPLREVAYLGDYVWELAQLVRDRIVTATEIGYSAKKLLELADRFPKAPTRGAMGRGPEGPDVQTDEVQEAAEAVQDKPEADAAELEALGQSLGMLARGALVHATEGGVSPGVGPTSVAALATHGLITPRPDAPSPLTEKGRRLRDFLRTDMPEAEAAPAEASEAEAVEPEAVPEAEAPSRVPASGSDAGSRTARAVERVWAAIQDRHAEIPDVVVISGGGVTETRNTVRVTWGHFHADQWTTEGGQRHELLVSGECLGRGAEFTLTTVLHEAAHALAHVRKIKETSRKGKYHNKRFLKLAAELGLEWPEGGQPDDSFGFNAPQLTDATRAAYAGILDRLEHDRAAWRALVVPPGYVIPGVTPEGGAEGDPEGDADSDAEPEPSKPKSRNTKPKAICGCEDARPVWMSRRVLASGKVGCFECGERYRAADPDDEPDPAEAEA